MDSLRKIISGNREIAGAQLKENALRAGTGLLSLGVQPGDRVAVLMRNDFPQIEAILAAQHIGAYAVQMNWHGHAEELEYVLADCGAQVLVAHEDLLARLSDAALSKVQAISVPVPPEIMAAYRLGAQQLHPRPGVLDWKSWLADHLPSSAPPQPVVESIIYTSGTTGKPKGVRRFAPTPQQVELTRRMREQVFGVTPGARVLVPAPLYHTAPNLYAMTAVRQGELLLLPPRFDPEQTLADIARHRISHVYMVPTLFTRLLALPEEVKAKYDLSSLTAVLHAGGPCAISVKKKVIEWLGPVVNEYYGSTEAGPSTFCSSTDWLKHPGTVGKAVVGACVEVHGDDGRKLSAHEVGELWVRNDGYPEFTYLNRPGDRADVARGDMLVTGDLGYFDEEGYFYLCDRKRDLVISGGVNIYPAEIEAVLQGLEGVQDCAVFGIPDEAFGEALAAHVQLQDGAKVTEIDIRGYLVRQLAGFKMPRLIEIHPALPRDEAGKIKKRVLREPYWAGAGRTI